MYEFSRSAAKRFCHDESGATAIEYGLIASIIALGIIVTLDLVSVSLDATFTDASTELTNAGG